MKYRSLSTFLVSAVLLLGCAGAQRPGRQTAGAHLPQANMSGDEIAWGKSIYTANCAGCHGVNLEGQADWKQQNEDGSFRSPPHTAGGHTWHHADSVLIEAVERGGARFEGMNIGATSNMPAFSETLTDEEILAVLAYIKSTWPEDVSAFQRQMTEQDPSS